MTTTELIAVLSRFPSQREIEIAIDHGAWSIIFPLPLTLGDILRGEETRFKKGQFPHNRDPGFYVIGALRVNADGCIDMRVSFEHGSRGWRGLHRILWEDAHGPVPAGHSVCFKNGDKLDCELANLELVPRHELMRRNSIHNFPEPIAKAVLLRGALVRAINRKTRRGKTTPD